MICAASLGGTTSACAENTDKCACCAVGKRNYLRVRGEYVPSWPTNGPMLELPPRARRIRSSQGFLYSFFGTTSACAENTCYRSSRGGKQWNYLRVRGEYMASNFLVFSKLELPPRARRILLVMGFMASVNGTTSACAENTLPSALRYWTLRNYLRVRGEYRLCHRVLWRRVELPPRARRIHLSTRARYSCSGTTSACAENT